MTQAIYFYYMKPNSNYTTITSPHLTINGHILSCIFEWAMTFSYPGCTRRPSPHSESGPQWCSGPKSHRTPSSSAASPVTWCHRLHPRPAAWCDLMSCGTRCPDRRHTISNASSNPVDNFDEHFPPNNLNLQAEPFLPDGVQVAIDGLCPFLGLSHLDGDIRVTRTSSVLGLETLSAHNWQNTQNGMTERLA